MIAKAIDAICQATGWRWDVAADALTTASMAMKRQGVSWAILPGKHVRNLVERIPNTTRQERQRMMRSFKKLRIK